MSSRRLHVGNYLYGPLKLVGEGKYLTSIVLSRNATAVIFFPPVKAVFSLPPPQTNTMSMRTRNHAITSTSSTSSLQPSIDERMDGILLHVEGSANFGGLATASTA